MGRTCLLGSAHLRDSFDRDGYLWKPVAETGKPPAKRPGYAVDLRYARGEISTEQYEQLRRDLEG